MPSPSARQVFWAMEEPGKPGKYPNILHLQGELEDLDPKVNFHRSQLSPVLEHYAELNDLTYGRLSLGNSASAWELALAYVQEGIVVAGKTWYPAIPIVRDEGFSAVLLPKRVSYEEACRLFGFEIAQAKLSIPKRIKRHQATPQTALFGKVVGRSKLNEFDEVLQINVGGRKYSVAYKPPSGRWVEGVTDGSVVLSRRFASALVGHPVDVGEMLTFTGLFPDWQVKGNGIVLDQKYDLCVFDVKPEIHSTNNDVYVSCLLELKGGGMYTDVQTVSNLELAAAYDGRFLKILGKRFIKEVFNNQESPDKITEEIGFYSPSKWVNEEGEEIVSSLSDWKLWKVFSHCVPDAMRLPHLRRAYRRMKLESRWLNNPDRLRLPFREPEDLRNPGDLTGAGVRRYLAVDPFGVLASRDEVYVGGGFHGEVVVGPNPNSSNAQVRVMRARVYKELEEIDRGVALFVHPDFFEVFPGEEYSYAQVMQGKDLDDGVWIILDLNIVKWVKGLTPFPKPTMDLPGSTFESCLGEFDPRVHVPPRYDAEFVSNEIQRAMGSTMGLGYIVNCLSWFVLVWTNRESFLQQLEALPQSNKRDDAIYWMKEILPELQMPLVAWYLEDIIDGLKMGKSDISWARLIIDGPGRKISEEERQRRKLTRKLALIEAGFRPTCPVAPEFWWHGGWNGEGRIPRNRMGTPDEPIPLRCPIDTALDEWRDMFNRADRAGNESDWLYRWRVPKEILALKTDPMAKGLAKAARGLYVRVFWDKKEEFQKTRKDHRGRVVTSNRDAGVAASLFACAQVDRFIMGTGLYTDVYTELVKLVYTVRGVATRVGGKLTFPPEWLEEELDDTGRPVLDEKGKPKKVAKRFPDGILGGPETLDGFIAVCRRAGLTKRRHPIHWADNRRRWDYGSLRGTVVADENGHIRMIGTEDTSANHLGFIEGAPAGTYALDKGHVLVPEEAGADVGPSTILAVVQGWETKLRRADSDEEREGLATGLAAWLRLAGRQAKVVKTTWTDKDGEIVPAGRVYVDNEPVAWVKADQAAALKHDVVGVLADGTKYTLVFLSTEKAIE